MANKMPYSVKIAKAIMAGDYATVEKTYQEALGDMAQSCCKLVESYSFTDLPMVLAAMQIVVNSMKGSLNEGGLGVMNQLIGHTSCIVIDAGELRRQAGGGDAGGNEA
ncbi:MAG: hypothetical protein IKC09_08755 [Oscillospiraceae bacterium]|nr:hypothetical protein [Oscillospiraceae bacterium]